MYILFAFGKSILLDMVKNVNMAKHIGGMWRSQKLWNEALLKKLSPLFNFSYYAPCWEGMSEMVKEKLIHMPSGK